MAAHPPFLGQPSLCLVSSLLTWGKESPHQHHDHHTPPSWPSCALQVPCIPLPPGVPGRGFGTGLRKSWRHSLPGPQRTQCRHASSSQQQCAMGNQRTDFRAHERMQVGAADRPKAKKRWSRHGSPMGHGCSTQQRHRCRSGWHRKNRGKRSKKASQKKRETACWETVPSQTGPMGDGAGLAVGLGGVHEVGRQPPSPTRGLALSSLSGDCAWRNSALVEQWKLRALTRAGIAPSVVQPPHLGTGPGVRAFPGPGQRPLHLLRLLRAFLSNILLHSAQSSLAAHIVPRMPSTVWPPLLAPPPLQRAPPWRPDSQSCSGRRLVSKPRFHPASATGSRSCQRVAALRCSRNQRWRTAGGI